MISTRRNQIIGIDLIRFFAAFIVMLYHLCYFIWAGRPIATTFLAAKGAVHFPHLAIFKYGFVGVDVFFVVSGFIIAYSASSSSAFEFVRSRLVRLMPAIWIVAPISLVALFAINFAPPAKLVGLFVSSMLLWPMGPWVDGVYWTLSIEVAFYAVVLALLLLDGFVWIGRVMALIGLISATYLIATWAGFDPTPHFSAISDEHLERLRELLLIEHGCFFALGVFLWLLLFDRVSFNRCLLIACFGLGCVAGIKSIGQSIIWFSAVFSIAASVRFNSQITANSSIAIPARVLGLTTYPLYLLHNVVGAALMGFLVRSGVNQYVALLFAMTVVVSLAVTIAVIFEPLAQRWLRSKIDHFTFSASRSASSR